MGNSEIGTEMKNGIADGQGSAVVKRYQRYKTVVRQIVDKSVINVAEAQKACDPEQPRFVKKIIRELEQSSWLIPTDQDQHQDPCYTWNQSRGTFEPERWLDQVIFGTQVTNSPAEERPRERLLKYGATHLQTSELLAILIRSGRPGESAIDAGKKLARHYQNRIGDLPSAGRAELKEVSGAVEVTAYCQIMAGIELGRRIAAANETRQVVRIQSSADAIGFCERRFARLIEDARQEEFHIVTLDTKNQIIDSHQITIGTLDASLVHPREVFRRAIKDAASSILLVHNHPSGDPTPSRQDISVTRRLLDAGKLIGIEILDHIVLGAFNSTSIREHDSGLFSGGN